jgi:hypothetical protein
MTDEQQGVSPVSAGGASAPGPWDIGHSPATGGRNLYVRDADGDVYVGVIFEPADARRIVEAMNAAERPRLADPRDAEIKRLRADKEQAEAAHDRLRADLARERAIYADSPDDRLYHAADHTWWRRADGGRLVAADAPPKVMQLLGETRNERDRLRQELADVRSRAGRIEVDRSSKSVLLGRIRDILGEADAKPAEPRIAEDRCGAGNEDYPELRCKLAAGHQNDHEDPDQGAAWSPEIATPAEPRRWHVGDPEPEIGTTVWRRADKYTRSSNGWHRVDIHTGYASWAWILSVGSEIVEAIVDPKDGA